MRKIIVLMLLSAITCMSYAGTPTPTALTARAGWYIFEALNLPSIPGVLEYRIQESIYIKCAYAKVGNDYLFACWTGTQIDPALLYQACIDNGATCKLYTKNLTSAERTALITKYLYDMTSPTLAAENRSIRFIPECFTDANDIIAKYMVKKFQPRESRTNVQP